MPHPENELPQDPVDESEELRIFLSHSSFGTPDAVHERDQGNAENAEYEAAESLIKSTFSPKLYEGEAPKEPQRRRDRGGPRGTERVDLIQPGTDVIVFPSTDTDHPYKAFIKSMHTPLAQPNNSTVRIRPEEKGSEVNIAGATRVLLVRDSQ